MVLFLNQYFVFWDLEMASAFNPLKVPSAVPRFLVLLNKAPLMLPLNYTLRRLLKLGILPGLIAVHIFKEKKNVIYNSK